MWAGDDEDVAPDGGKSGDAVGEKRSKGGKGKRRYVKLARKSGGARAVEMEWM